MTENSSVQKFHAYLNRPHTTPSIPGWLLFVLRDAGVLRFCRTPGTSKESTRRAERCANLKTPLAECGAYCAPCTLNTVCRSSQLPPEAAAPISGFSRPIRHPVVHGNESIKMRLCLHSVSDAATLNCYRDRRMPQTSVQGLTPRSRIRAGSHRNWRRSQPE